jgi:hypothetical protein
MSKQEQKLKEGAKPFLEEGEEVLAGSSRPPGATPNRWPVPGGWDRVRWEGSLTPPSMPVSGSTRRWGWRLPRSGCSR